MTPNVVKTLRSSEKAIELALAGESVCIVSPTYEGSQQMFEKLRAIFVEKDREFTSTLQLSTGGRVSFYTTTQEREK